MLQKSILLLTSKVSIFLSVLSELFFIYLSVCPKPSVLLLLHDINLLHKQTWKLCTKLSKTWFISQNFTANFSNITKIFLETQVTTKYNIFNHSQGLKILLRICINLLYFIFSTLIFLFKILSSSLLASL